MGFTGKHHGRKCAALERQALQQERQFNDFYGVGVVFLTFMHCKPCVWQFYGDKLLTFLHAFECSTTLVLDDADRTVQE